MSDERTTELSGQTGAIGEEARGDRVLVMWQGKSLVLDLPQRGELRVGRAPECDVHIEDPSVSRHHAVLEVGPRVRLRALKSQNGTRLGGRKLADGEAAPFHPGLVAQMGSTIMLLESTPRNVDAGAARGELADVAPLPALSGVVLPVAGAMHQVFRLVAHVARSKISVLLLGETGVGKEIVCEAVSVQGSR